MVLLKGQGEPSDARTQRIVGKGLARYGGSWHSCLLQNGTQLQFVQLASKLANDRTTCSGPAQHQVYWEVCQNQPGRQPMDCLWSPCLVRTPRLLHDGQMRFKFEEHQIS